MSLTALPSPYGEPLADRPADRPADRQADRQADRRLHPLAALSGDFRELSFLRRISAAATTTRDAAAMLKLIVDETTEVMGADVCSVYRLEEGPGTLVLQAASGLSPQQVGRLRLQVGEGVTGWVAQHRQPLTVEDVQAEPRFKFVPGVDEHLSAMLSVPVVTADRVVGVFNLQTRARRAFDDHEVDLLRALAGQVAGLIEISHLNARVKRTTEQLDQANRSLERLKQRVAFETEQRLRGDFIEQLLVGENEADFARVRSQAAGLGLDLGRPHYVVLADVFCRDPAGEDPEIEGPAADDPAGEDPAIEPAPDLRRLQAALAAEVQRFGGGTAVLKHDAVVVLFPTRTDPADPMDATGAIEPTDDPVCRLQRAAEAALDGAEVRCVAGDVCLDAPAFRVSYRQARRALETMRRAGRSGVMSSDELGAYQLLLAIPDARLLQEFAQRELGQLLDYDARNGTCFTATLEALLRHNGNFRRTAAELHVHTNTLTYRLRRVREITGIDLEDANRRTTLYLATLILRLQREGA